MFSLSPAFRSPQVVTASVVRNEQHGENVVVDRIHCQGCPIQRNGSFFGDEMLDARGYADIETAHAVKARVSTISAMPST